MRPKPIKIDCTTDEASEKIGPALRALMIKNVGANDVYIDFDNPITAESYVLEAGETMTMEYDFILLYHKAVSGTSTLHGIKIIQ